MILRFNPRTPCGVRLGRLLACKHLFLFQSTHSLRSATHQIVHYGGALPVSIHALLAECDGGGPCLGPGRPGFNPRTPCGVRQWLWLRATRGRWFQSTHSLRSATVRPVPPGWAGRCFNPRTPCGVRRFARSHLDGLDGVSIHALLAECDISSAGCCRLVFRFNPRTPCGVRPSGWGIFCASTGFNPRTPCGVRLAYTQITRTGETFQSTHSLRSATNH